MRDSVAMSGKLKMNNAIRLKRDIDTSKIYFIIPQGKLTVNVRGSIILF